MTERKDSRSGARQAPPPRRKRPDAAPKPRRATPAEAVDIPRKARRAAKAADVEPVAAGADQTASVMKAADAHVRRAVGARKETGTAAGESRHSRRQAREAAAARAQASVEAAEAFPEEDDVLFDTAGKKKSGKRRERTSGGDLFEAEAPSKPKPSAAQRVVCVVLSLAFLGGMAYIGWLVKRQEVAYAHFQEMKRVVENQTFYEGTTVEGVDVSAMTLRAALDYWQKQVEPQYSGRTVTFDDGTTLTAAEMGYVSDYESVLSNAWSAGRRGSLESRYRAAVSHQENPVAYRVTRVLYDEGLISDYVDALAEQIDRPAKDAALKGFNMKKLTFTFTDAQKGRKLRAKALKASIAATLQGGSGTVTREIETLSPKVTAKALKKQFGRITTATTNASSSSANRLGNIRQALKYINGTCLEPGETFSFNQTVGKRTTDRGFKIATAYSSGDVTEEVGGGICQVSTTLFNAAVKADLKIVERHNHSLTVAYVDSGKDATVNWGSQDLRFKNTSGEKMYIVCFLSDDKRVRVGIFGKLLPNGESITVEAETTEVIEYETEYQRTDQLAKGKQEIVSNGKQGCKAVAYKVRWDSKGRELSREVLCKSWYRAKNEVVAVGA